MTVNLCEAKTSLSKLVERGAAGDRALRKPRGWEDNVWVADDFDEPSPPRSSTGSRAGRAEDADRATILRARAIRARIY